MTSFSVVTVVYNDVTHIKETMDSVINQSYKNLEYILIDGVSNDGTKETIIEQILSCATITHQKESNTSFYLEAIHNTYPTLTFKFLSEKDKGIYDAMNKGIALASKEWINFINCGDRFYNLEVLDNIRREDIGRYDVVYGDINIYYLDQHIEIIKKTSHDLKKLYALFYYFGHPNCFIKAIVLKSNPFNLIYQLSADYDLVYKLYKQGYGFGFVDTIIATFHSGGASDKKAKQSLKEALKIALRYNKNDKKQYPKIYLFYWFARLKKIIKLYLPPFLSLLLLKAMKKNEN